MSDNYSCYLDKPSSVERVKLSIGNCLTATHTVHYAGVHQPCTLTVSGAMLEPVIIKVSTGTRGSIGSWKLTREHNRVDIFEIGDQPLSFYIDDSLTCKFYTENGRRIGSKLFIIKIVQGNAETEDNVYSSDSDYARETMRALNRTKEVFNIDEPLPPGTYMMY